jgi:hypothetical protein
MKIPAYLTLCISTLDGVGCWFSHFLYTHSRKERAQNQPPSPSPFSASVRNVGNKKRENIKKGREKKIEKIVTGFQTRDAQNESIPFHSDD